MTFNQEKYLELLNLYTPKPIKTEEEYTFFMIVFEKIFNEEKSKENDAFIILLALLIEEYESEHYPIPELTPLEFIKGMMENLELTFNDLVSVIGNEELTQQILDGTYEIDKPIAKVLGKYFSVDYRTFL